MEPLVFEPFLRPMVWGGRELERLFGKRLPTDAAYGESWEISGHPSHVSVVAEGPHRGRRLTDLMAAHGRDLFGARACPARFPLLIKLLDCHELLSVQVHPTDELARQILGDELGKTEAWVILAVGPKGRIYAGLKPGVTREILKSHLAAGTVEACLHEFRPRVGDCLFLESGTVHAVGGGVVMAEVQQTSDATFRLFDWNRMGKDGKPRALHLEESLRSINFDSGPCHPISSTPAMAAETSSPRRRLVDCRYFRMDRIDLGAGAIAPQGGEMAIYLLLEGAGELSGAHFRRVFKAGETVLIPASADVLSWRGLPDSAAARLLEITLPSWFTQLQSGVP